MNVNEVSGSGTPIKPSQPKKIKDEQSIEALKKDSVELSDKAKALYNSDKTKHMQEIQQRMLEGFYNRADVMEKVVDSILQEVIKKG